MTEPRPDDADGERGDSCAAVATSEMLTRLQALAAQLATQPDEQQALQLLAVAYQLQPGDAGALTLARGLIGLVDTLQPTAPLRALRGVAQRAIELMAGVPQAPLADLVTTLERVAALAGKAEDLTAQVDALNVILQLAASRPEVPDAATASVYLRVRDWCESSKALNQAALLDQAVLRFFLGAPDVSDASRARLLNDHVARLMGWQADQRIEASLVMAETAAREGPWPLTRSACHMARGQRHDARGAWPEAARAYEQAMQPAGLAPPDRMLLHGLAARAWMRAGAYDDAARHSRESIRLRLRAPDGDAVSR